MTQYNHPVRRYISDLSEFEIATVNIDGSNHQLLLANDSFYHPVWSPSGEMIAYSVIKSFRDWTARYRYDYRNILHTMQKDGSDVRIHASEMRTGKHPAVWSNDSERIVFIGDEACHEDRVCSTIFIVEINDSSVMQLPETSSLPAWSPDDQRIAFVRNEDDVSTILTIGSDGANLQEIASFPDVLPELEGSGSNHPLGGHNRLPRGHVSWSSDGSEIRLHQSPFVVVNADGSNLRMMRGRTDALASWSPDESQIAVYLPGREVRLFTMNADGTNKQSLVRWDSGSGELVADRGPFDIDGFDWEAYPSAEVSQ